MKKLEIENLQFLEILTFLISRFFRFTPLNFHHLIAEAASPGPIVSVPTPGSWEYGDFICKTAKKPSGGGIIFSVYGIFTQDEKDNEKRKIEAKQGPLAGGGATALFS